MIIHSRFKDYKVNIENNFDFLQEILNTSNAEFVVDTNVYKLYENQLGG